MKIENYNLEQLIRFSKIADSESSAYSLANHYARLLRLSRKLNTADTHSCNGTRYATEGQYQKAIENIYTAIEVILEPHGLNYFHQTDPRGASLHIDTKELSPENYTNGIAIY